MLSVAEEVMGGEFEDHTQIGTDVASDLEGGALAMGLICCVCIVMVVWIENSRKSKP